ncbi:reverse transcriptase domain-containing protein [Tanacetum coccineum]
MPVTTIPGKRLALKTEPHEDIALLAHFVSPLKDQDSRPDPTKLSQLVPASQVIPYARAHNQKFTVDKHNESPTGLLKPIRLSFDHEGGPEEEHDEEPEDLRKPYKEILKSPTYSQANHTEMFQQTLDGPARGWFDRLPNGCIESWTDLREAFVERFALRRKCCKDPTEVAKIVRKANETLPDFKERWTEEMRYIPDIPVVMQLIGLMKQLQSVPEPPDVL